MRAFRWRCGASVTHESCEGPCQACTICAVPARRLQAKTEIMLLDLLQSLDGDDKWCIGEPASRRCGWGSRFKRPLPACFAVRLREQFECEGHTCLVFEQLSFNLYELLHRTRFNGVSLNLVRKFARQLLKTLAFLSLPDVDIVHCDLKPENILLRVSNRSALKVIDFGSSCRRTEPMYVYIQSRFYRSPEVILGLPYAQAIDMWSLGCILVELHVGTPLFAGEDEHDQLIRFVALKGMPPQWMLERGKKTAKFFNVFTPRVSPPPAVEDSDLVHRREAVRAARAAAVARRAARAQAEGWTGYVQEMAPVHEKPVEGGMPGSNAPLPETSGDDRKTPAVSKVPMKREHDWPADGVPIECVSDEDAGGDSDVEEWDSLSFPASAAAAGSGPAALSAQAPSGGTRPTPLPAPASLSAADSASGDATGSTGGTPRLPTSSAPESPAWHQSRPATTAGAEGGSAAAGPTPQQRRQAAHAERMKRLRRPQTTAHRGIPQYHLKPRRKPSRRRSHSSSRVHTSLSELLGVRSGGPGGRRAGEAEGHTQWHYQQFMDMIMRMLEFDPHLRMTPMQALNHPFLREDNPPGWEQSAGGAAGAPAAAAAGGESGSAASSTPASFPPKGGVSAPASAKPVGATSGSSGTAPGQGGAPPVDPSGGQS